MRHHRLVGLFLVGLSSIVGCGDSSNDAENEANSSGGEQAGEAGSSEPLGRGGSEIAGAGTAGNEPVGTGGRAEGGSGSGGRAAGGDGTGGTSSGGTGMGGSAAGGAASGGLASGGVGTGGSGEGGSGTGGGEPGGSGTGGELAGGAESGGNASGGSVGLAGAADGGSAGSLGGNGGMAGEQGECSSNEQCPGGTCQRIPDEPGGYWTCVIPPTPVEVPSENPAMDQCTTSADCDPGCSCIWVKEVYSGYIDPHNECACGQCQSDDDCDSDQICLPGGTGTLPASLCFRTHCRTDADCAREAGGACVFVYDSCSVDPDVFYDKACHYPSSPCRVDGDCQDYQFCVADEQNPESGLVCAEPMCPG